ncbi:MAG: ATP-binding protein, partial [Acidimicrobiales bacterium]
AVLALLAVLAVRSSRQGRGGGASDDGRDVPAAGAVDLDRIVVRVADGARAAGLPAAPSSVEVEAAARRVEGALTGKRHTEQLAHDVEEASTMLDEARRQLAGLLDGQAELAKEVAVLGTAFGVDCDGDAHALADAVNAVEEIRALARRRASITASMAPLDDAIGQYATEVAEVARELGGTAGRSRVEGGPTAPPDVLEMLDIAGRRLDDLLTIEDRRRSLEATAAERDTEIDRSLGSGADGERLRAELESGDVVAWSAERVELAERIECTDAAREELLRAQHDAERDIAQLERSARVAELEASRGACAAELGTALEQYAVLTLARSLLSRTLALYERERQPAVVASASTLFAAVTEDRYVRLVARVDPETGRSRGLEAISATGARVDAGDLSRGTAEQLYLCLRLALADSFATRAAALPFVLDDVLVNFDPTRARAVARVVADIGRRHQVLAFTCHPHVAEMLMSAAPDARLVELGQSR